MDLVNPCCVHSRRLLAFEKKFARKPVKRAGAVLCIASASPRLLVRGPVGVRDAEGVETASNQAKSFFVPGE